ncbi:fanconi-associated nuclease 1-like [Anneissia japonica]|uniref:fanconi-associated nuclease 1-like n=1 Tax=Anneissia japonica TaxID=1529436 RepID=UPI001425B518|nr:fanconi-associated nuclease 1-like [Anneissia japonica]
MSDKRSLYRAAPAEDSNKEKRRSLSQGRLVSKPALADSLTVYACPGEYTAIRESYGDGDASVILPHEGAVPIMTIGTPPRQILSSLSNLSRTSNDVASNPRKFPSGRYFTSSSQNMTPSSPSKPRPTHTLDLSDSDPEITFQTRYQGSEAVFSPVQLVDASGSRRDPSMAEVDIKTDIIRSPVKVVCHAPTVIDSDLRNSGSVANTARIAVDSVPSMSLLGDLDVTQAGAGKLAGQEAFSGRHKQPMVIREKATSITDSESIMEEIEAEISRLEKSKLIIPKTPAEKPSEAEFMKEKKKKPKGRVVQSRYKQPTSKANESQFQISSHKKHQGSTKKADVSRKMSSTSKAKAGPQSATKRTVRIDDVARQLKSFNDSHQTSISKDVKESHQRTSRRHHISDSDQLTSKNHRNTSDSQFCYTPMARGSQTAGGATSTPAGSFAKMPVMLEESIIAQADASIINQSSITSVSHNATQRSSKEKHDVEISQAYLDKMYDQYLQWIFLDSKARKAYNEQEKEVMSQFYGLWMENEKIRKRQFALKLELERVKHNNRLDQHLDIQRQGLGPVVTHLKKFQEQYRTLAHGVDTTRHQLPTTGIIIPENEEEYQDALQRALNESQQLLGEISLITSCQQTNITSLANASQMLEKAVENELKELSRCQELLTSTTKLATQESSIKMQQIQQRGYAH